MVLEKEGLVFILVGINVDACLVFFYMYGSCTARPLVRTVPVSHRGRPRDVDCQSWSSAKLRWWIEYSHIVSSRKRMLVMSFLVLLLAQIEH